MRIMEVVSDNPNIPIQVSARGGRHFFFRYQEGFVSRRIAEGLDLKNDGGYIVVEPSTLNGGSWEWAVGKNIFQVPPPPMGNRVESFLKNLPAFIRGSRVSEKECQEDTSAMFSGGQLDEDIFTVSHSLVKGGMPEEQIQKVLEVIVEYGNKNRDGREPWTPEMVSRKVKAAMQYIERADRNISQEIRDWVSITEGTFDTRDIERVLHLTELKDQKNMWAVLDRMVKDGILEKVPPYRGKYRTKRVLFSKMDFKKITGETLDIRWPLGIERFYKCYPSSVAVLAGAPGSGKTTYCLNFCLMNLQRSLPMKQRKVTYLSSELGEEELANRISLFGYPMDTWDDVSFIKISSNFEDAIDPNGINIIDYLEEYEEFWKISLYIKKINDMLREGMALIALQRPYGREVAKGGEGTLEKPRIYLTMSQPPGEPHRIKILKCHNWVDRRDNPKNKVKTFLIVNGSKLEPQSDWVTDNTAENPMGFKDFSGRRR